MSKVLEKNKDIIHIVCEVVAFSILTYIFSSKYKKLSNEIVMLNNRITEQNKKFEEYDIIISNLSQNKRSNIELKPKCVEILQENRKQQTIKKDKPLQETIQKQPIQQVQSTKVQKPSQQIQKQPIQQVQSTKVQKPSQQIYQEKQNNSVLYNESSETTSELDAQLENELKELDTEISKNYSLLQSKNEEIQKEIRQETKQETNEENKKENEKQHFGEVIEVFSRIQSPVLIPEFMLLHENIKFDLSKIEDNSDKYNYSISRTTSPNPSPISEQDQSNSNSGSNSGSNSSSNSGSENIEISTCDMEEYRNSESLSDENVILETISMIFQKSN